MSNNAAFGQLRLFLIQNKSQLYADIVNKNYFKIA
jgi:hypothetical protein